MSHTTTTAANNNATEMADGYVALGYSGSDNVIWSTQRRCVEYINGNAVTTVFLETHGGLDWLFRTYGEKTENGGLKINLARARSDLIAACQRAGRYIPEQVMGSGVWYANINGKRQLVCNSGSAVFDRDGNTVPRANTGAIFAEGRDTGMRPNGAAATDAEVLELAEFFETWTWSRKSDAALLLGWVALAPFSGAIDRRPLFAIHAPPKVGKSTLLECIELLFGRARVSKIGSSTTAAALSQEMESSAMPVLLDEIFAAVTASKRDAERVNSVLAMLRVAFGASGDGIGKGGADGVARTYSARFSALIASRHFPQLADEDRSRMIYCRLNPRKPGSGKHKLFARKFDLLPRLGERLRMRMFYNWESFVETAGNVAEVLVCERELDDRFAETVGQAIAAWYVITTGRAASLDEARRVVSQFDLSAHVERMAQSNDARDCADWLLGSVPAGATQSVGDLVRLAAADNKGAQAILETVGIKLNGTKAQVAKGRGIAGLRNLFAGSTWADGLWAAVLEQVPGATEANPRFSGKTTASWALPLAWLFDEPEAAAAPVQAAISSEGF